MPTPESAVDLALEPGLVTEDARRGFTYSQSLDAPADV
jgi:hypothetical protein